MGPLGIKGFEWVIILIVILVIFGPKNLPKLGKALGNSLSSLREGMAAGKKKKGADSEGEGDAEPGADEAPSAPSDEPAAPPAKLEAPADPEVESADELDQPDNAAVDEHATDVSPESEATESNAPKRKVVKRVVRK